MPARFEVRIDKIRLRGPVCTKGGRNTAALQEKYIARAGGGAYMAVAPTEESAINEVIRIMGQHYRRMEIGASSMAARIRKALETPCERVPGAANDIRHFPVSLLGA